MCLQHDYIYVHFHESIIHIWDWCSGNDWLKCIFICIHRLNAMHTTHDIHASLTVWFVVTFLVIAIATYCARSVQSWYSIHKTMWWILNWNRHTHSHILYYVQNPRHTNMLRSLFMEKVLSIFDMDYIYCIYAENQTGSLARFYILHLPYSLHDIRWTTLGCGAILNWQ